MTQDISAIIVTYYPNRRCLHNLSHVAKLVKDIVVVDNGPVLSDYSSTQASNMHLIHGDHGIGLSAAINQGIEAAILLGHDHFFIFDQDSRPTNQFFNNMLSFKRRLDSVISNCAFCIPNFYDRNSGSFASFPIISKHRIKFVKCGDMHQYYSKRALIAITSGMLLDINKYRQIGPFREDFMIDFLDNEYCLRSAMKGYVVAVNCSACLNHSIGMRSRHYFMGIEIKPNHHPPIRRYFMSRNMVRTCIEYFSTFPAYAFLLLLVLSHEVISILLFENHKFTKISSLIYGFYHGLFGKTVRPEYFPFHVQGCSGYHRI